MNGAPGSPDRRRRTGGSARRRARGGLALLGRLAMAAAAAFVVSGVMTGPAAAAPAQAAEPSPPDADAMKAFTDLVKSYRARPALHVKSTLEIRLQQGDLDAGSREVTAEITCSRRPDGKGTAGEVKIGGFTCRFADGVFTAVHDETEHSYYREEYEGSPYWPILVDFQDIPYPHLALLWGEEDPAEVCMQLLPQTPEIVPTRVSETQVDGATLQSLELTSPNASLRMLIDPHTHLIKSMEHEITGGNVVQPGTKRVTKYRLEYTTYEAPLPPEELAFDPGDRQRVDLLGALMPATAPGAPGLPGLPGVPGGLAGQGEPPGMGLGGLVGRPAPEFVLATADGKAIDLEDLRGRVVVLDFWATWCRPCAMALPLLHEVAAWARQEELPVEVVTLNVWEIQDQRRNTPDARLEAVRAFWKKNNFTLPVAMDYTDATARSYGVQGIPTTIVVRSDGVVHAQHSGFSANYVTEMKREIKEALEALEAPAAPDQ